MLWEVTTGRRLIAKRPLRFRIMDLFAQCPEVAVEFAGSFGLNTQFIALHEPMVIFDESRREAWIRFSVSREDLKSRRLPRPTFIESISHYGRAYHQVRSGDDQWSFEMRRARPVPPGVTAYQALKKELDAFNLFTTLDGGQIQYLVPLQNRLLRPLPQIVLLYTLTFWFGSLVRYDPHSVADLRESRFWMLLDGFMNQSRVWLLELFEWHLYRAQTTLVSAR